ncbi:MAG: nucleotidyl transferase AbiEii/AbiGii toxin family protein [Polyangiales bacterium]
MAERPENQVALALLERLDGGRLREASAWFAGGTAISLRCGEFRVSRDVDFLCASNDGYRELRARVRGEGARGLFTRDVDLLREPRIDRYGIRLALGLGDVALKLEIVSEGRISLSGFDDAALPVARLTDEDLVAEKLLANDDRYLDDSALGRDAVDLLMLERTLGALPDAAWTKARVAYGASVDRAWEEALRRMRARPDLVARAFDVMGVSAEARDVVRTRLARLPDDEA